MKEEREGKSASEPKQRTKTRREEKEKRKYVRRKLEP